MKRYIELPYKNVIFNTLQNATSCACETKVTITTYRRIVTLDLETASDKSTFDALKGLVASYQKITEEITVRKKCVCQGHS